MCPGLTSPGAKLYPAAVDTVVVSFLVSYIHVCHKMSELSITVFYKLVIVCPELS